MTPQRNTGDSGASRGLQSAEHATFLELDFEKVNEYTLDEQKKKGTLRDVGGAVLGGVYEVQLPEGTAGQLIPTFSPKFQVRNRGVPMEIKYYVRLDGKRRQTFRLNDKIKVPLQISYPSPAISSSDLSGTNTGVLKFIGVNNVKPKVEAILTDQFSYQPLNVTGDVLRMRLVANIVGSNAGFAALSSTPIIPRAKISRKLYSRPQSNNKEDGAQTSAGIVFGATILKPVAEASTDGSMVWEGEMRVSDEERSVTCDWMRIFRVKRFLPNPDVQCSVDPGAFLVSPLKAVYFDPMSFSSELDFRLLPSKHGTQHSHSVALGRKNQTRFWSSSRFRNMNNSNRAAEPGTDSIGNSAPLLRYLTRSTSWSPFSTTTHSDVPIDASMSRQHYPPAYTPQRRHTICYESSSVSSPSPPLKTFHRVKRKPPPSLLPGDGLRLPLLQAEWEVEESVSCSGILELFPLPPTSQVARRESQMDKVDVRIHKERAGFVSFTPFAPWGANEAVTFPKVVDSRPRLNTHSTSRSLSGSSTSSSTSEASSDPATPSTSLSFPTISSFGTPLHQATSWGPTSTNNGPFKMSFAETPTRLCHRGKMLWITPGSDKGRRPSEVWCEAEEVLEIGWGG
ncbi:hypothetical protein P7C70_g360, partial [Phenoliferia sp. Uapishka_3]